VDRRDVRRHYRDGSKSADDEAMSCIAYRDGYAYQLKRDYTQVLGIKPAHPARTKFVDLEESGLLTIRSGYAWDGPSGPAIDTPSFMRGSLVHDALYQLMGEGLLDVAHREAADRILRAVCIEDGMAYIRAWWVYKAVRAFGEVAMRNGDRPMNYAPERCEALQ
jgi:Protein of unknown function (DUF1353)